MFLDRDLIYDMIYENHLWAVFCYFSGPGRCKFYKTILHWPGKLECLCLVSCLGHQMYMDKHWASFRRLLNYHPALDHPQYANLQQTEHLKFTYYSVQRRKGFYNIDYRKCQNC